MNQTRVLSWEAHLIQRASEGETIAFELLIDLYRSTLQNLAMRMLRNADDAYDAVQETLIKAFKHIKEFDSSRPFKPWLCRICSNCCVDVVRNRRHSGEPLDQHEHMLQDQGESLEHKATGNVIQGQLLAAISRLPENYRRIIMMRHFQHKDVIQIAQELEKPEGTIKSWLFRARALLKKDLQIALG